MHLTGQGLHPGVATVGPPPAAMRERPEHMARPSAAPGVAWPEAARQLPGWCDAFLHPPGGEDFFASRAWYDSLVAGTLPGDARAVPLLLHGAVLCPLMEREGRRGSLTTPYTVSWRPLPASGASVAALREAGRDLARLVRQSSPWLIEAVDAEARGLEPLLEGLRRGGVAVLRHDHFGNWHEAFPPGTGWDAYLGTRDPALRATIRRKLARAARDTDFELVDAPGAALEAGIADYEAVRGRSWKPFEPCPGFDAVLMRAAAATGALRLGVLRDAASGLPAAAQYWVRSGERAWLLKLAHDEARRADSPGTVLTALMIRHLLGEGVRELDFGRGDDPYKRLWVGCRRQRIGLTLAGPFAPEGLAAVARHGAGRVRRAVLARLGRGRA
jgi:hypothetical protein